MQGTGRKALVRVVVCTGGVGVSMTACRFCKRDCLHACLCACVCMRARAAAHEHARLHVQGRFAVTKHICGSKQKAAYLLHHAYACGKVDEVGGPGVHGRELVVKGDDQGEGARQDNPELDAELDAPAQSSGSGGARRTCWAETIGSENEATEEQ